MGLLEKEYTVFEDADIVAFLSDEDRESLAQMRHKINAGRKEGGRDVLACVVIPHEAPEPSAPSRPMTMAELAILVAHAAQDHAFCRAKEGQRHVKYIAPQIDMRTFDCFAVQFRGASGAGDLLIHTQNECRDLPESLFERCMAWLDESPCPEVGHE